MATMVGVTVYDQMNTPTVIQFEDPYDLESSYSLSTESVVDYYSEPLLDDQDRTFHSIADFCRTACATPTQSRQDNSLYRYRVEALESGEIEFTTMGQDGNLEYISTSDAAILSSSLRTQATILYVLGQINHGYLNLGCAYLIPDGSPHITASALLRMPVQLAYTVPNQDNPNMGLNRLMHIDDAFEILLISHIESMYEQYSISNPDHGYSDASTVPLHVLDWNTVGIQNQPAKLMNPFPNAVQNFINFRIHVILTFANFLERGIQGGDHAVNWEDWYKIVMADTYFSDESRHLHWASEKESSPGGIIYVPPGAGMDKFPSISSSRPTPLKFVPEVFTSPAATPLLPRWIVNIMTLVCFCFYVSTTI